MADFDNFASHLTNTVTFEIQIDYAVYIRRIFWQPTDVRCHRFSVLEGEA